MADQRTGGAPEFLSPEAMITPGLAGGATVLIANTLALYFPWPAPYVGLVVSFMFGLLVLVAPRQWWLAVIYYVLNSLTIFCVAFGANTAVVQRTGQAGQPHSSLILFQPALASPNTMNLNDLQRAYIDLVLRFRESSAKLSALEQSGGPQKDIDTLKAKISDIEQQMEKNLQQQQAMIKKGQEKGDHATLPPSQKFFTPWQLF